MERMLINATQEDELRVALVDNGTLLDLDIEYPGSDQIKSNIYKGRISSIEPSLGAVFVDYGRERHGFLPLKEISKEYFISDPGGNMSDIDIRKVVKLNQQIVVQVEKEERGNKGAALTTFISLAGSYLVLMPNNPRGGGISRRIEGEQRDQLRAIIDGLTVPDNMSVIIRTAGIDKSKEELEWDLTILLNYWNAIVKAVQAAAEQPGAHLIHQESDVIIRAIRDYLRHNIHEIIVDDPNTFERAKNYIARVKPDFADRIKLYTNTMPLFSCFQVEQQIEAAYQREINLPSGGSIVIDHTEALVSIDINSARSTKGGNIEETALNTNLEAADEIARQMRIRDIGGLIVIDFIDMLSNSNQRKVEDRMRHALRHDRARIQVSRISRFGLLEMSRQRLNASLSRSSQITCSKCEGRGTVRSIESLSLSILRLIEERAVKASNAQIQLQLPLDMCTFMINERGASLFRIQQEHKTQVILLPNEQLTTPHYILKTMKDEPTKQTPTYKLAKSPRTESPSKRRQKRIPGHDKPFVNAFLDDNALKTHAPKRNNNLIKRLWDTIFGVNSDMGTHATSPSQSGNAGKGPQTNSTSSPKRDSQQSGNRGRTRNKAESTSPRSQSQSQPQNRRKTKSAEGSVTKSPSTTRKKPSSNKSTADTGSVKRKDTEKANISNTEKANNSNTEKANNSNTEKAKRKPTNRNATHAARPSEKENGATQDSRPKPKKPSNPAARQRQSTKSAEPAQPTATNKQPTPQPKETAPKQASASTPAPSTSMPSSASAPASSKASPAAKEATTTPATPPPASTSTTAKPAAPAAPATPASNIVIPKSGKAALKQVKTRKESAPTKQAAVSKPEDQKIDQHKTTSGSTDKPIEATTQTKTPEKPKAQQFSADQYLSTKKSASTPLHQVKTKKETSTPADKSNQE